MVASSEVEWPKETIYTGFSSVASEHGSRPAVLFEDRILTYDELLKTSLRLAGGLAELGVQPGDKLAVWLANRPLWIQVQLAASYLGAAVVAVNTRYRTHEIEYMLRDSGCKVLITEEEFLERNYLRMLAEVVPSIRSQAPPLQSDEIISLSHVITLQEQSDFPGALAYEGVIQSKEERDLPSPSEDPKRPVVIFYTSGTTSRPKGCLHCSRSVLNHSYRIGCHFNLTRQDTALGALPFCGVMGYNLMLSALTHGIPLVAQPYFNPDEALRLIEEHEVTYFSGTDEMFRRMINSDQFDSNRALSLRKGCFFFPGGYDAETFERLETQLEFPLVQPYGLSEGNSQIFMGRPEDPPEQRKKVGGPLIYPENEEVKVIDLASGEELPPGEQGELCLRGENVMLRYLNKPEETQEAFDNEDWLHTGDLGHKDEQGYFYWDSRLDDALRVRGFLVSPREIQDAINCHPDVNLVQVVGASHSRHGEVPVAFVKTSTQSLSKPGLLEWLEERIADYKIPEEVVFVDEFPRTEGPHGSKIQKNKLRDQIMDHFDTVQ